jgi:hypothetical protein
MTRSGFKWFAHAAKETNGPSHILGLGLGPGLITIYEATLGGVLFPVLSLIASRDVSCLIRRWAAVSFDHF